ncbi:MAG: hypothetical protein AAB318_01155, partial [Planctomycetota bacterium]
MPHLFKHSCWLPIRRLPCFAPKGSISILAIIMLSLWMGRFPCYGDGQDGLLLPLFRETQQASVFYLDNGMEVVLIENHASPMIA